MYEPFDLRTRFGTEVNVNVVFERSFWTSPIFSQVPPLGYECIRHTNLNAEKIIVIISMAYVDRKTNVEP